jgi:hypothetical protein
LAAVIGWRMEAIAILGRMAGSGEVAMRKLMAIVAGVVVLGLAASMTFASESPQRTRARDLWRGAAPSSLDDERTTADRRIVVVIRNERETFIDNPPRGEESQGDEVVISGTLHRPGVRPPIGRVDLHAVATLITRREFRFLANIVSNLPHGEIEATGVARFTERTAEFEFGVTGGTDAFDDVGGELNVVEEAGEPVRLVYDLRDLD